MEKDNRLQLCLPTGEAPNLTYPPDNLFPFSILPLLLLWCLSKLHPWNICLGTAAGMGFLGKIRVPITLCPPLPLS